MYINSSFLKKVILCSRHQMSPLMFISVLPTSQKSTLNELFRHLVSLANQYDIKLCQQWALRDSIVGRGLSMMQ